MNIEKINQIRKLIEDKEQAKEDFRLAYEEAIAKLDADISKLKIELADVVLSEQNAGDDNTKNQRTFVSVKFNDKGKTYDYLWDSEKEVNVGDTVEVESRWHGMQTVEVVGVFKEDVGYMDYDYKSAYPLSK